MATAVASRATAEPFPVGPSLGGRQWCWRAGQRPLDAGPGLGMSDLAAGLFLARGCDPADIGRLARPALRDWMPDP
jgi:hypothetical protein